MMLSIWFKVVVLIIWLQFATSNFDEFVENEDPLIEDVVDGNSTNPFLTGNTNRAEIFHGIQSDIIRTFGTFTKNVEDILHHSESTTPRHPSGSNNNSFDAAQLPSGPPHGSLLTHSVSTLIRFPYEGARIAKDLLIHKGIAGSHEGGLWDRNADPVKEHGNMERLGRDFVNKVVHAFETTDTQGLDTNKTFFSGIMDRFKEYVHFIYPGTIWCGEGDVAEKPTDLGMFTEPDKCCRHHDKCHDYIEKGKKKYGLENTGMFTRSHCSCDSDFRTCLRDSKSAVGHQIGFTYFTVLGPQCFEEAQKIESCDKTIKNRCIKYKLSKSREKKYQWFDNPTF